uniref:protein-serine/threonine phosphatase n=1 Tax=Strigamia maritima TaxID=126957 RepID=T1INY0_STRMM
MIHSIPDLIISKEHARVIGNADKNHLLAAKKLALLVDLDQTIIHTTNDNNIPKDIIDVFHFKLQGVWNHTRLRPGTRSFSQNMSKLYELHICTYGSRRYAHNIARLIACSQTGFHHVMKVYARNLVRVRPYNFFESTGDINAPLDSKEPKTIQQKARKFKNLHDSDKDKHLLFLEQKLRDIHRTFYEMKDTCFGECLCGILSGNELPEKNKAWNVAKSLGAVIQDQIVGSGVEATTHLIASRLDTKKAYDAKRMNVRIGNLDWLLCCAERWQKVDEAAFSLLKSNCVILVAIPKVSMTTVNPFLNYGKDDVGRMEQEVDDDIGSDESDDDGSCSVDDDDESGNKENENFRKRERSDSDDESENPRKKCCFDA